MKTKTPRRRTPYLKKQNEYDKDRYVYAEYPHVFRRSWPKKKACVHRKERHQIRALTQKLSQQQSEELSPALLKTAKSQISLKKEASTLRELTQWKLARREAQHGARKKRQGQPFTPRS